MSSHEKSVHVATIKKICKGKEYVTHLLRHSFREDGKVKHETLGNLSHLPAHVIELVRRGLRGESVLPAESTFEILRSLPHGHVAAVLQTLRRIGLDKIIQSRRKRELNIVEAMVVMRIVAPGSKLGCAQSLRDETATTSLGSVLGLTDVTEDDLYEGLDWLLKQQDRIEKALAERHLSNGVLVLYDITSVYFEGHHCPLAKLGHSRDDKKGLPQIVVGLLCNDLGCPVSVEVFSGNTGDPSTIPAQIEKVRRRFGLSRVIFVGDRGMITDARIRENFKGEEGLEWITALRAPAIQRLRQEGVLQMSLFDVKDLAEIAHEDFPGERLVACRNPFLAEERARKRSELLAATEKELEKVGAAVRRPRRPLRGKDKIGVRIGRVLGKFKMGKHFIYDIADDTFVYHRNEESIAHEAALDGIYVIRTSVAAAELDADDTVRAYKGLAVVERAFRTTKTVDLHVRPVYHRLEDRVRAHVFLCMLAYYVEWYMRQDLSSILFDDDDKATAEALRRSIVSPAQRSPRAKAKAINKRTTRGEPVQGFRKLLGDLATLCKNKVRIGGATFDKYTTPTPLQRRVFELLKVNYIV